MEALDTIATVEESRRHTPAPGDHYRNLYHSAYHRDVRVVRPAGDDAWWVTCQDLEHVGEKEMKLSAKQLRPSWTGRSGWAYLGPWMTYAQLRPTPEGLFSPPLEAASQPAPEVGQVWFSLREADALRALTVTGVTDGVVSVKRHTPGRSRTYQTTVSLQYWYPAPTGRYGYIYGFPTMEAYAACEAAQSDLPGYIAELRDRARFDPTRAALDEIL